MKIKFLKTHFQYKVGQQETTTDEFGGYLVRMGVAEKVEDVVYTEKKENKTGNVPTAKKKK
jgi:hypothetical protein